MIGKRLYDKLLRSSMRHQVEGAIVVDVANVDEYCAGQSFTEIAAQCTCLRPPFPKLLLEAKVIGDKGLWGVLINTAEDVHFTAYMVEYSNRKQRAGSVAWWEFEINPDGSYKDDTMYHDARIEATSRAEEFKAVMMGRMWVALMAVNFMHCKNVTLVDNELPIHPKQAKKLRGSRPVTYKTIVVRPFGSRREYESTESASPSVLRDTRIVRGHFKTFSEEAPLFGKWAGMFWWSPQVRGNPQRGYRVDAPEKKNE